MLLGDPNCAKKISHCNSQRLWFSYSLLSVCTYECHLEHANYCSYFTSTGNMATFLSQCPSFTAIFRSVKIICVDMAVMARYNSSCQHHQDA